MTSRTGLLASPTKKILRGEKKPPVALSATVRPAPFILKPFAGLYNPYPYGCSLLCNHPTDTESKELVKRAKEVWASEGKNLLLAEEVQAIRENLQQLNLNHRDNKNDDVTTIDSVPEELFRRYTETDSRPLTPAPTLASAYTKASGNRRCITPDIVTTEVKEKTMLVLDLRRSHSQDTLSWYGSSQYQEPPLIKIFPAPMNEPLVQHTPSVTPENGKRKNVKGRTTPLPSKFQNRKEEKQDQKVYLEVESANEINKEDAKSGKEEDEEEPMRRRGKKKKKRSRSSSAGPLAFLSTLDPETQIATVGEDSHTPSKRPSITSNAAEDGVDEICTKSTQDDRKSSLETDSFLDKDILRHLRRQLNEEIVDNEFDSKKRRALMEALKTVHDDQPDSEQLQKLKEELNLTESNVEYVLSLPRAFSRSNARFELPMDSSTFSSMTPMDYLAENVVVTSARKLVYNCIFKKYKVNNDLEKTVERKILGKNLIPALGDVMGKEFSSEQAEEFQALVNWKDEDLLDFKTFCGVCALCERILASKFCPVLPTKKQDPCHETFEIDGNAASFMILPTEGAAEKRNKFRDAATSSNQVIVVITASQNIERADFESLCRRLSGQKVSENLEKILYAIMDS